MFIHLLPSVIVTYVTKGSFLIQGLSNVQYMMWLTVLSVYHWRLMQLYIYNSKSTWYCSKCLSSNLPFNHYSDEDEFLNSVHVKDHFEPNWDSFSQKLFNPFDFNHNDNDIPLNDADPGLNFYNEIFGSFSAICNYYQEDSFNVMSQKNVAANYQCPLSLGNINIRSMNRNFQSVQQYLAILNFEFAAIGASETRLTKSNPGRHSNERSSLMESLFVEIPGSEFKMEKYHTWYN